MKHNPGPGLQPRADVSFHPLGGAAALFDPVSQRVFTLDEPEAVAWCLLAEAGGGHDQAAADLARVAGLSAGQAHAWLGAAAAQWSAAGLLDEPPALRFPTVDVAPVWPPPGGDALCLAPGAAAARRRYRVLDSVVEVAFEEAGFAAAADAVLGGLLTDAPPTLACALARLEDRSGWAVAVDGRVAERVARASQSVPTLKLALTRLALGHARGFAAVHAAAVARRGGDGGWRSALLPAPAGSGKSTLAAGCMLAGLELVADDTVVLDDSGLLRPMPFALCLKEGSWPVLRRAGAGIDALPVHERPDERLARYLPPRVAADGPRPLAAVVTPRWEAGAPAELRRASPREAFDLLLPQVFPLAGPPLNAEAVARVASLVERVPCFTLSYDALADGVRLVGEALAS